MQGSKLLCIRTAYLLIILCAFTSFTNNAYASIDFLALSPEQLLGAEVISASRQTETVARTPAAVFVITQDDIARAGVTSIADALRMAPGVEVAQGDSNSWAINIRGFNKGLANQLLVMIDGRTIYNPLFGGTYWDLQNLPLENIERIEVVRGPGGALWGANAVNGVINVITKKSSHTQGNLVVAGTGNYERGFVTAQHGGTLANDIAYRVYGQHFNRESFDASSGNDAGDTWHDNRVGFRIDQDDSFTVQGDAYVNDEDQLVSVPYFTPPFSTIRPDHLDSNGANILGRWKKNYDDSSQLSIQSYLDYTFRSQTTLLDKRVIFDTDSQFNLAQKGRHAIVLGGGYRLTYDDLGNTPILSFHPSSRSDNLFSVFMQDKIALVPESWFLTLGSKVEHNDYTGFEFQPNARLQWFPDDHQTWWGAISKAVRTPSRLERDINLNAGVFPGPIEFQLTANPDFRAERLIAYELGYRNQVTSDFSIDIATFYNNYNGLAAQAFQSFVLVNNGIDPAHFALTTTQRNLMAAETYGAEIATDWNVSKTWKVSAGYSFLKMFIHLSNDFTNQQAQEQESPQHQANIRSHWDLNDNWTLDTSAYAVSKLSGFRVPAYVRIDANLGWKIHDGIQFNLIGQNLLDRDHREFNNTTDLNAAEVPRSVFGKLTWNF
jgi:iron complex outermembrane receptor protein